MNKKLITLAVSAAMVAPLAAAAETTLYGRMDTAVVYSDVNIDDETEFDDLDEGVWDVDTASTRIGVKGSEDLGNGLSAIFQAEWAFDSSEGGSTAGGLSNRLAYAGLSGGFGTVAIGRQWTPYYGSVDKYDVFNNPAATASAQAGYLGAFRTGDAVSYVSPNFSGFDARLMVIMDNDGGALVDDPSDGIDAYNPALNYNNGPISVGISTFQYDSDLAEQDIWGIGASYNFGMFKLIAAYEDMDETNNTNDDDGANEWTLLGEAYFGNNIVRAQYGQVDYDLKGKKDLDVWAVGFQHNFSARTRVYAEYYANDNNVDENDLSEFALGLRHDF